MLFGADLSNYQWQFSPDDARRLVAMRCSFGWVGRQRVNIWHADQARYLREAGVHHVGEYLINVGDAWPELYPETRIVAIDVEAGGEFVDEASIDNALLWVRQQGRTPIIYSSAYMWQDQLGLDALTKYGEQGVPLWNAHYDGKTDGYDLPRPFGGWTTCVMDQYTDGWVDGGLNYKLDMNDCADGFWGDDILVPAPVPVAAEPAAAPAVFLDYPIASQQAGVVAYGLGRAILGGKAARVFRAKDDPERANEARYVFAMGKVDVAGAFADGLVP